LGRPPSAFQRHDGQPPSASYTQAIGINDAGQIVGYFGSSSGNQGFLNSGGTFTTLMSPVPVEAPFAFGIYDRGQIVGYSNEQMPQGFLDNGGTFTAINVPGAAGTFPSISLRNQQSGPDRRGLW
jgi:hypothetical protein